MRMIHREAEGCEQQQRKDGCHCDLAGVTALGKGIQDETERPQ
jgi:hypothetical protein